MESKNQVSVSVFRMLKVEKGQTWDCRSIPTTKRLRVSYGLLEGERNTHVFSTKINAKSFVGNFEFTSSVSVSEETECHYLRVTDSETEQLKQMQSAKPQNLRD